MGDLLLLSWLITQIVVIVLKFADLVAWGWGSVLSPTWIPVGFFVGLYIVLTVFVDIPRVMWRNHKRKKTLGF